MRVSWNWLKDYIPLQMSHEELTERLSMTGLNHEGTDKVGDDWSIDLEVTSNRPDCLGHIGVAREISVVFDLPLKTEEPSPAESSLAVADLVSVDIQCPELCPRYSARVIRGAKIGPSPDWLVNRLKSVFRSKKENGDIEEYRPINNVADVTNYVLMETGQPLHAFDYDLLADQPLRYRQLGTGYVFYSVGNDATDDGGDPELDDRRRRRAARALALPRRIGPHH